MINVAIVGVGNCASALVQGVAVKKAGHRTLDGVVYQNIGGYFPQDVNFVVAFDVDQRKVGKKLKEAIFSPPNCCWKIIREGEFEEREKLAIDDCDVLMAPIMDGVSKHMTECDEKYGFKVDVHSSQLSSEDIIQVLKEKKVDVIVNYLPVGSQIATEFWANICLEAEIAFCNCIPVFIASNKVWEQKFIDKGLPLIGDDMRSQFGASVLSQMFQELAFDRGHTVHAHIQQNFGGNTDFLNMKNQDRLESKKISKENVIKSQNQLRGVEANESFLFAGPSDYIQYYGDNKIAHFRLEMAGFGGAPVILDAKLSVQDSPNSAGVVIDAIRFLKVAREMGIRGSLRGASAFTQKTPPEQLQFADAKKECDALAARLYTEKTRIQMK